MPPKSLLNALQSFPMSPLKVSLAKLEGDLPMLSWDPILYLIKSKRFKQNNKV